MLDEVVRGDNRREPLAYDMMTVGEEGNTTGVSPHGGSRQSWGPMGSRFVVVGSGLC